MINSKNISTTVPNIWRDKSALSDLLRENCATITFTKKDGTDRVMKCTLLADVVIPHEKKTDRTKAPVDHILPVWDIEAGAWRSVNLETIKDVMINGRLI